jgi:hypothetical protein
MLANPVSLNRRFTRGMRGTTQGLSQRSYMLMRLKRGGSIYIGDHRYDPEGMRIYYKNIDKKMPLPQALHRSRIEITLRGDRCPFHSLEEAKQFEFSKLNRYFKFRQPIPNMTPNQAVIANAIPLLGERKMRLRRSGSKYMFSDLTMADSVLNEIVYDQLRYLTRRLNSSRKIKSR